MKIIVNIMLCASCALAALRGSAVPPRETKPTNLLNGWKAPERAVNAHGRVLLQPGETEITGIANSLMEDHFDVGAHFAWTIVTADSGETFKIDTPHGERYKSTPVRWIVREKSQDEIRSSRQQHQQHFAEHIHQAALVDKYKPVSVNDSDPTLADDDIRNSNNNNNHDRKLVATPPVTYHGPNSIIVIRVNILDGTNTTNVIQPSYCDETCAKNIMWDGTQNVAGQFLDTSDGFTFDKTQSTVITVNTNVTTGGTTCDFDGYADAAIAAAQLVGYTAANYGFRLFIIPQQLPCSWGGLAYVGCSSTRYCRAWVRYSTPATTNHELGHSCGMNHASLDTNNDGTVDVEYGDSSDPLGSNSKFKRFNAVHRYEMGWLPASSVAVNPTGALTLQSASVATSQSSGTALVQLTSPITTDKFYISLRTLTGAYDSTLPTGWGNIVYFHRWHTGGNTMLVQKVSSGGAYAAPEHGISFSIGTITTTSVPLTVSQCVATTAPTLSIPTPLTQVDYCGSVNQQSLTLSVTSNNVGCGSLPIEVYASSLPNGWTVGGYSSCSTIVITFVKDSYPSETSWDVTYVSNGSVVLSGTGQGGGTYQACAPTGTLLKFTIRDSAGDGICCGYGAGSYTVMSNGVLVGTGGAFATSESWNFAVGPRWVQSLTGGSSALINTVVSVPANTPVGEYLLTFTATHMQYPTIPTQTITTQVSVLCGASPSFTSSVSPSPSVTPSLSISSSSTTTPTASPSMSASSTKSRSITRTPTKTISLSPSISKSSSTSVSSSRTPSVSLSSTPSPSYSSTASLSWSPSTSPIPVQFFGDRQSLSNSQSWSPSNSQSWSPSNSQSWSPSNSQSWSPSNSQSLSPSISQSLSSSISQSWSPSNFQSLSPSNSQSWSPTNSQSWSPSNSQSLSPSNSPSLSPSITPTPSTSLSPSPSITPTPSTSLSPSPSITPTPSTSLSPSPSITPTPSTSRSPSPSNTNTASATRSRTPSISITKSPSYSPSPSKSPKRSGH